MQTAEKLVKKQKIKSETNRKRAALALILSIAVIIGIFWWLKLVGITMVGDAFCGLEEHMHSEECTEKTLLCTIPEGESEAGPAVIAAPITAAKTEAVTEAATEAVTTYTDTAAETAETEMTSEKETKTTTAHVHGDRCYEIRYTCGREEHVHDVMCYSDSSADLETAGIWDDSVGDAGKTADFATNLVEIARTQLGIRESDRNYQIDDHGERHGYNRYGAWYGNPYSGWSGMFVSFCLHYSGVDYENLPYYSGVETMRLKWEEMGVYKSSADHAPETGDVIFLDSDSDGKADRAAIVSAADGTRLTVITGDYNGAVCEVALTDEVGVLLGGSEKVALLTCIATDAELERAEHIEIMIDALPSFETIAEALAEYEAVGDMEGYADYFLKVSNDSRLAYGELQDMGILGDLVDNSEDLQYYQSLWASDLAVSGPNISIYGINRHSNGTHFPILFHNTTISTGWSYASWSAYYVKKDDLGYYIDRVDKSNNSKSGTNTSAYEFVILVWRDRTSWDASAGDRLEIDFAYKNLGSVSSSTTPYGTVTVVSSNNLKPIQSADTMDLIEVNVFNYGNKINSKYSSNKNYPGFQQEYGTLSTDNTLSSGDMNFGNNITADMLAGIQGVTTDPNRGDINKTVNGANTPVQGTMACDLGADGYPQLAYSAAGFDPSLKWLFSNNTATTTTQLNTQNVNGLFLQDPATGKYYFDSRLNFAQYNKDKQVFELYEETMTPNYIMYPFGNFLPFNNINTQGTKVTSINRWYFVNIATIAQNKQDNGFSTYDDKNEYGDLNAALDKFVELMDNQYGSSWNWTKPVQKYFSLTSPPDIPNSGDRFTGLQNQVADMYNLDYDEPSDFYFGMSMHMDFIMPKDGTTGPEGDQPMSFDFNGDDDVWVYVDGKLFLDLSGIHRHVGGRIDFQNGRVEYYQFNAATGLADISVNTGLKDENGNDYKYTKTVNGTQKTIYYVPFSILMAKLIEDNPDYLNEEGTFHDYTAHTIDFFYMERGSGSSVCNMEFNFPLIQRNSISITKEMTGVDDTSVIGDPDFKFQVIKASAKDKNDITADDLLVGPGVKYTVLDSVNGIQLGEGVTDENGIITIKAGQTAVVPDVDERGGEYFVRELLDSSVFEQYGTVTVDGRSVTKDTYKKDITVGEGSFAGLDSDKKDISNGSTSFAFTNHIDEHEYGNLTVSKIYRDYNEDYSAKPVEFELAFDGVPVPSGTRYILRLADGSEVESAVSTAGVIAFNSDESVHFPKILAGTTFTLKEKTGYSAGYVVDYSHSPSGVDPDAFIFNVIGSGAEQYGQGIIPSATKNEVDGVKVSVFPKVTVTNDREGTKLTLPMKKSVLYNADGETRTYVFTARQITSMTDLTPVDSFTPVKYSVTTSNSKSFDFVLNFPAGTLPGTMYYLISEDGGGEIPGYDSSAYIVAVDIVSGNDGVGIAAEVAGYYRLDGTEVSVSTESPLTFFNRYVRSLTVSKTVLGAVNPGATEFTFTVTADVGGSALQSAYPAVITDSYGNSEQTEVSFTDGIAIFKLKHGQQIRIDELPYKSDWTVTEETVPGFRVQSSVNGEALIYSLSTDRDTDGDGTEDKHRLSDDTVVTFYNTTGSELPATGSAGQLMYIIAGSVMMLGSLVLAFVLRRRRERRER